jgi:hypothetical protein
MKWIRRVTKRREEKKSEMPAFVGHLVFGFVNYSFERLLLLERIGQLHGRDF